MNDPVEIPHTYSVVGIRRDGTQSDLIGGLTLARAEAVRDALAGTSAFSEIRIEEEPRQE
jgi:hypothetical protein